MTEDREASGAREAQAPDPAREARAGGVTPAAGEARLSRLGVLAYAGPSGAVNYLYMLVALAYLNYSTDQLGMSPAVMGWIWLVSRLWDAVSDPLFGQWSDRSRTPLGRRKPWLLASGPAIALLTYALWAPPQGLSPGALTLWVAIAFLGFFSAQTAFEVPHLALGAELSRVRLERTRIFGTRQFMSACGMLAGALFGVAYVLSGREPAAWHALVAGTLTAVLIVVGAWKTPAERPEVAGRTAGNLWKAMRNVMRNPHARILLAVIFIENLGSGGIGMMVPYAAEYVTKRPDTISALLGCYALPSLLTVPLWMRLARRIEKRKLWTFAMAMGGVGFGMLFWLEEGDFWWAAFAAATAGIANSCVMTLGQALKADVIDWDEHARGERNEGAYFAAWNFCRKSAVGVIGWVAGISLSQAGYLPGIEQSETVKDTLRFMIGGLPMIGYFAGALLMLRFGLSEAVHARIVRELDARRADE